MSFEFDENTPDDEILVKLYQHESLTAAEKDSLFNYMKVPKILRDLLNDESLRYIDLVDDPEIINRLPHNPLDAGGKEYLAMSVKVANKINKDEPLNTQEKSHLMKDIVAQLESIFRELTDTLDELDINKLGKSENEHDKAVTLEFKGYPKKSLFHTSLLSRDLPLLVQESEEETNHCFIKRRKNSNDIIGTLTFDDVMKQHDNLAPLDMVHYIGVCRLYDSGTRTFTPDMLVRATYADNKKTVTPKQRDEAIKSVNKLMKTVIDIDVSEEYRAYNKIGKHEELFLGENMLYARRAKLKHSSGSVSWGYELLQQPVLDVHAFNLGQIDRLDNELVETSGGKEDLLLTNYLSIRLASLMSDKNKMSNVIRLDTVYRHIDVNDPNRQKAAQIRRKIDSRLTEWKNKKVIRDFEFMKEGNKITKFKIVM